MKTYSLIIWVRRQFARCWHKPLRGNRRRYAAVSGIRRVEKWGDRGAARNGFRDNLQARISTNAPVKMAFIMVYRFEYPSLERWTKGRLPIQAHGQLCHRL